MGKNRARTVDMLREEFVLLCEKTYRRSQSGRAILTEDEIRRALDIDDLGMDALRSAVAPWEGKMFFTAALSYDKSLEPLCLVEADRVRERRKERTGSRVVRLFHMLYVWTWEAFFRAKT
jgi:hypothetical protein